MYDEVVSAYAQDIKFVVGFAGSGKSTKLAEQYNDKVLVLVPTHKAAEVLKNKGMKQVYTIHSVLKLVPTINQEIRRGQRLQRLQRIGDTDLSSIRLICIDEFSMINTEILDLLLEVLPENCEVNIFGDPYQLPPVDGEPIDPTNYTEMIEELTIQHRSEAPEVVETFMRFMRYIKDGSEMNLRLNPVIKKGSLKTFNPETDRILAYTNEKVIQLNDQVAGLLGLPKEISNDENVLANDIPGVFSYEDSAETIYPTCIAKGKLKEGEDLIQAMQSTENDIERFNIDLQGYDFACIYIDGNRYSFYYDLDHYKHAKELEAKVKDIQFKLIDYHKIDNKTRLATWCRENQGAKYVKERGQAWSEYLMHQNYIFNLRRPFATTVHKAQGSEFSTVFIAVDDIKKSISKNYYMQYARLMYVALSRATKKVAIV